MSDIDKQKLESLKKELQKFKKGDRLESRSRTTPLGKLFDEIFKKINGYQSQSDIITYLYNNFDGDSNNNDDRIYKRSYVIEKILNYLDQIKILSKKIPNSNIISIPLYDIRIIGDLTNIIILQGIYSIIPNEFLIPLEKRKIKNFKKNSSLIFNKINLNNGLPIIEKILITMTNIFESNSDLKDLILVGTGFTDTLSIAIFLTINSNNSQFYMNFIQRLEFQSSTYQLLSFYSIMLKNCHQNLKFSSLVSLLLSNQLMKKNGIESLIDLVLGLREDEEIDISKIQYIVKVLLNSKPKNINLINYYKNIFNQIYNMLILVNRPLINTILVEIIVLIYSKNNRIIKDFLFSKIWFNLNPNLNDDYNQDFKKNIENDSIIITNGIDLNNSFNVCISIIRSLNIKDQEIINELFNPILLSLWYYANYQKSQNKDYNIILNLIKNIIILGDSNYFIDLIISNIIDNQMTWMFDNNKNDNDEKNNLTFIKFNTNELIISKENQILRLFDKIDFNIESFIELITKLNDSDSLYLNKILIEILNKLISNNEKNLEKNSSINKIIYLKLIQAIIENFKLEIENSPISLLIFANTYFNQYFDSINSKFNLNIVQDIDSDDEDNESVNNDINNNDEIITFLIPILEIISTLNFNNNDEKIQLENLQSILNKNENLIPQSIKYICEKIIKIDTKVVKVKLISNNLNIETILKQINDQTPSVRVYALDKLTNYTINNPNNEEKKQVSTKYTINLLLSQLKDSEPFVYLNAIKNIVNILSFDKSFLNQLIELYSTSKKSIDEKLRIGEILTKFVNINGKILNNIQIDELINICINISRSNSSLIENSSNDNNDIRMKMSSLSLLGTICHQTGYSIISHISQITDLVHGIITFEKNPELKRAAVVIINDIVTNDKGLEIIKEYGEKLQLLLEYISKNDKDLLVCQMSSATLDDIAIAFENKFQIN
ncbi:hypothetical protein C6P40_004824 [Pichia californica]|uniref:RNA polymerase II assembly factor Rtp1 C-terminal domain-containing protein n=1 Tax=Pichia californica TaxID=460514 RepID=A0A9P7BH49_9ASCO|nr:hypothetical protein C6P40_004824 [[Candida] californica]